MDIIAKLEPFLKSGALFFRDDGKMEYTYRYAWDTPWLNVKVAPNSYCNLYLGIFHPAFNFLHSKCQECWKVVVAPRTLEELFNLLSLQRELYRPSKCGIEVREYVPRLYGGYFYNDSLEEGRECYKLIRERVDPEIPIILKRGCTELEMHYGPSDKWTVPERQKKLEAELQDLIVHDVRKLLPPDVVVNHIYDKWVLWAFAHGDQTYLKYADENLSAPSVVTYHDK